MSQTETLERTAAASIDTDKWDKFIYWAAKFRHLPYFDEEERDYKLAAIRNLTTAKQAFERGEVDWQDQLSSAFNYRASMTNWRAHAPFLEWCQGSPDDAATALRAIWNTNASLEDRVDDFLSVLPKSVVSGPSARLSVMSYLLLATDATGYAVFRSKPFNAAFRLTGTPPPPSNASDTDRYLHAIDFIDRVVREAQLRDLELRDRLDAQSVVWTITGWDPDEGWSQDEKNALRRFRGWKPKPIDDKQEDTDLADSELDEQPRNSPEPSRISLESLADELLLSIDHLRKIERLMEDKKQAIFYGPPGTGKTYVARELAKYFARDGGGVDIVQFHPSYAYEDFIEGLRPVEVEGETRFRVVDGPLKRIAERARERPEATHVLLIDEINRGNLSKVLGELYFLLEYRDEAITLQYSDDEFALPENLWIIGTMNTADRSIALVDAALRRRFFFVGFFPDEEPIDGLLRRWLERNNPDYLWVADVVDEANRRLDDRHLAIGPSYFMKDDLDEEWLEIIWKHQVIPYLAEQFFGEEARLDEFRLKNLRQEQVTEQSEVSDTAGE